MTDNGNRRRWGRGRALRALALVAVALPMAAACGSSDETEAAAANGALVTETTPVPTTPVPTTPVPTTPVPTSAGSSETTTGQPEQAQDTNPYLETTDAFCTASHDVAEVIEAGDFFDESTENDVVDAWAEMVSFRVEAAILLAPNPELEEAPDQLWTAFEQLRVGFDPNGTFGDFTSGAAKQQPLAVIDAITDGLETYLTGPCGIPEDELEGNAEGLAAHFITEAGEGAQASGGGTTHVADDVSGIWLAVPSTWDATESRSGVERSIVVAPDVEAFNTSWDAQGVSIRVKDVATGSADPQARGASAPAWDDCTFVDTVDYADGVYRGQLSSFESCGGISVSAIVLTATTEDASVEIVLEMQVALGDTAAFDIVLDSFVV